MIKNTMIVTAAFCLVATLWIVFSMSRGYGKISDNSYQLATATYGACMAKSVDRINRAESLLEDEQFRVGISKQEIRWFAKIFADVRKNRWSSAAQAAKQMMEDQVD